LGAKSHQWPTCQHLYHFSCINQWRSGTEEKNAECPVCKSPDPILARQKTNQNNSQGRESSVRNLLGPVWPQIIICDLAKFGWDLDRAI
jgi:hypothetical protein